MQEWRQARRRHLQAGGLGSTQGPGARPQLCLRHPGRPGAPCPCPPYRPCLLLRPARCRQLASHRRPGALLVRVLARHASPVSSSRATLPDLDDICLLSTMGVLVLTVSPIFFVCPAFLDGSWHAVCLPRMESWQGPCMICMVSMWAWCAQVLRLLPQGLCPAQWQKQGSNRRL
jgi:hypothetical protein